MIYNFGLIERRRDSVKFWAIKTLNIHGTYKNGYGIPENYAMECLGNSEYKITYDTLNGGYAEFYVKNTFGGLILHRLGGLPARRHHDSISFSEYGIQKTIQELHIDGDMKVMLTLKYGDSYIDGTYSHAYKDGNYAA